ncbi:MAG: hypothetical protein WB992_26540 [Bryobacteraceae bacterium]
MSKAVGHPRSRDIADTRIRVARYYPGQHCLIRNLEYGGHSNEPVIILDRNPGQKRLIFQLTGRLVANVSFASM